MRVFRKFYGESPLHLLVLLASAALALYTATLVADDPLWPRMAWWFVFSLIAHDFVLFPVYAIADRMLSFAPRAVRLPVSIVNYVRIPVLASALTGVLFLPGIIKQGAVFFYNATGNTQDPYLGRWLLLCAVFFAVSAVAYVVRLIVTSSSR